MRQIRIAFDLYPLHKYDEHIVDCKDKRKSFSCSSNTNTCFFAAITLLYLCVYSLCPHLTVRDEQKVQSRKLEIPKYLFH